MDFLTHTLNYFLSFQPYIMLPLIIFVMAIVFRIKVTIAVQSALTLGIAFIGIFMTFDYFVLFLKPTISDLITQSGINAPVIDTGWPPLAHITWSQELTPLLLVIFMGINLLMLLTKRTKTVNIDIWNYWHVLLVATMIQHITGEIWMAVVFSSLSFILVLKFAEWSAPLTHKLSGMDGICIPHLSGIIYFPIALVCNKILDRIPGVRSWNADPEYLKNKIGLFGEPMILGLLMGLMLGIGAGYEVKEILNLAFKFAAVVYILPIMGTILGSALIPISEGMKEFIQNKFPKLGMTFIGLDVAVLFAIPSVLVTSILLMPVAVILSIVLKGVNFIPLGDLTNILVPVAIISVATKGNIIKSFLIGIPMVIINLYYASMFAPVFTELAAKSNYKLEGGSNVTFTSFLDGGNPYRSWLVRLLDGDTLSLVFLPAVLLLIGLTWKLTRKYFTD